VAQRLGLYNEKMIDMPTKAEIRPVAVIYRNDEYLGGYKHKEVGFEFNSEPGKGGFYKR